MGTAGGVPARHRPGCKASWPNTPSPRTRRLGFDQTPLASHLRMATLDLRSLTRTRGHKRGWMNSRQNSTRETPQVCRHRNGVMIQHRRVDRPAASREGCQARAEAPDGDREESSQPADAETLGGLSRVQSCGGGTAAGAAGPRGCPRQSIGHVRVQEEALSLNGSCVAMRTRVQDLL